MPAITIWPGALSLAIQQASGAAAHASIACSSVAPSSAAMRPGMRVGRGLRELGAPRREADAVVEVERAGRDERGDLSERVAGERDDLDVGRGGERGASASQAMSEVSSTDELRVAGAGEVVGVGVEEERCERFAERGSRPARPPSTRAGPSRARPWPGLCVP